MKTALYEKHVELNARIVDFHGWDMPLEYGSIINEHLSVRHHVGMFDVSHMGDITINGKDSESLLNFILPSDVSRMKDGDAMYTAFLNNDGCMIDDTIVYRMSEDSFFFVPNASTTDRIYSWVNSHATGYDVKIENVSDSMSCIAVQGPESTEVAERLNIRFPELFKFHYQESGSRNTITGNNDMIISGTGYTGEKGYEILIPNEKAPEIWDSLYREIKKLNGGPCGLGSRDSLRMEKGMLLSGTDFDSNRTPYESSISFIVDTSKDFIGQESLIKKKESQKEIFRGFILDTKIIPRTGSTILKGEEKIGEVTSGTYSPILEKSISLGYILKDRAKNGDMVDISIRERKFPAKVNRPKIVP